jgi:hypothetical protein
VPGQPLPFPVVVGGDERDRPVASADAADDRGEDLPELRRDQQQALGVGLGRGDLQQRDKLAGAGQSVLHLPMAETLGMTVAAWSPLAGGILSGKFTRPHEPEPGTRIDPASISELQRNVATTLHSVADDVGATPSQVAIAWTRKRSPAIHPIIGARRLSQLLDNLGATDVDLPDAAAARLDAADGIDLGFPAAFIRETSPWVFGAASLPGN